MTLDRRLSMANGVAACLLGVLAAGRDVSAQLSPDPYKPYNAQYEQYVYPSYPNDVSIAPNQSLLQPRSSSAMTYQRFLEQEDEMERASSNAAPMRGRRGVGVPYYRAYRDYDAAYGRVYSPNKTADQKYLANRQSRDDVYAEYLKENDPKKKAALLKEYKEYNQRTLRDLHEGRGPAARRAPAPAAGASRMRPPIPGVEAPRERRAAAPRSATGTSNSDVLRRSEALDQPTRPRPPLPTVPSRRAEPSPGR